MNDLTPSELVQIGLPEPQAKVYSSLLSSPGRSVQELAQLTGQKRTNIYHLLTALKENGLIKESETYGKGHFETCDPHALRAFVLRQQAHVQQNIIHLESIFPLLSSLYTLGREAPSVRTYEGLKGLETMYGEMLASGTKLLRLFRSSSDSASTDIHNLIRWVRKEQTRLGIHTKAITQNHPGARENYVSGKDVERLLERRVVPEGFLNNPAQILMWNNCVAISSLEGTLITTVVENEMTAETFENIFEFCWALSKEHSDRIIEGWKTLTSL